MVTWLNLKPLWTIAYEIYKRLCHCTVLVVELDKTFPSPLTLLAVISHTLWVFVKLLPTVDVTSLIYEWPTQPPTPI